MKWIGSIALGIMLFGCGSLGAHSYMVASLAAPTSHKESKRMRDYRLWVAYYKQLMGITHDLKVASEGGPNEDFRCAYVTPDAYESNSVWVVLIEGDPECLEYSAEWLAVHELCHIRLAHLWGDQINMSTAEKHYEVNKCMADYRQRRKNAR